MYSEKQLQTSIIAQNAQENIINQKKMYEEKISDLNIELTKVKERNTEL